MMIYDIQFINDQCPITNDQWLMANGFSVIFNCQPVTLLPCYPVTIFRHVYSRIPSTPPIHIWIDAFWVDWK